MTHSEFLPGVRPVATGRVSRLVVEQFEGLLKSGEITVGDRLPPERALAEMFGVGRNSIREALSELEIRGLVERRRGHGTHVRRQDVQGMMAPLRSVINLSATGVDDVIEFRRVFEPEVAALAAERAAPESIEPLIQAFRTYDEALAGDARSYRPGRPAQADAGFHQAVAQATGNPIIIALNDALTELLVDFRARLMTVSYVADRGTARGHKPILDAIAAGDPQRARDAMLRHLRAVESDIDAPVSLPTTRPQRSRRTSSAPTFRPNQEAR